MPALLARFDPDSRSWKTSLVSAAPGSAVYSATWPRSGMMRHGIAYQLPPLAPLTGATASGLWPTATTDSASDRTGRYAQGGMPLAVAVKQWPTPTGRDYKDGSAKSCANVPANGLLGRVVHQFPTPRAQSAKAGSKTAVREGGPDLQTVAGGGLNTFWVEWLMGFPHGWTSLPGFRALRRGRKTDKPG